MAKGIILFDDIPKDCGECPCCITEESFWGDINYAECGDTGKKHIEGYLGYGRPDNCRIKELPDDVYEYIKNLL